MDGLVIIIMAAGSYTCEIGEDAGNFTSSMVESIPFF